MEFHINNARLPLTLIFICIVYNSGRIQVQCVDQAVGEQFYESKEVKEYENYGSVTLFRFQVPDQVTLARWVISKYAFEGCPNIPMQIAIEAGSLPIINPYNASFPENTRVPKNGAETFSIGENATSLILTATNVTPGDWFIIVYREKKNDKIQQKGLSKTCYYFAQVNLIYNRLTFINTLSSRTKNAFKMEEETEGLLYKFLVESNIASVEFSITDCEAWSSNKSLGNHCPIAMQVQALRLPNVKSKSVICLQNVSTSVNCSLVVDLPLRETWYYVSVFQLTDPIPTVVQANITVSVTVCENPWDSYESLPYGNLAESSHEPRDKIDAEYPNATTAPFPTSLHPSAVNFTMSHDVIEELGDLPGNQIFAELSNITVTPTPPVRVIESPPRLNDPDGDLCFGIDYLSTNLEHGGISKQFFSTNSNQSVMAYSAGDDAPFVASFALGMEDMGGTLILETWFSHGEPKVPGQCTSSILCLRKDAPPRWNGTDVVCDEDNLFSGDVTNGNVVFHYPYPAAGMWYLALYTSCSHHTNSGNGSVVPVPCSVNTSVSVGIHMTDCISGCGDNGRCEHYFEDGLQMYGCSCKNDYVGWGCTDNSQVSSSDFLVKVLLLTLSNLIFLADSFLALYFRHFTEAASFFCTCFFSTFYHSCDSGSFCLMDYDTLQFCDFFASFMSIWLLLIAMARLPYSLKSLLHILGAYGLALGAEYDRFSIWSIALPLGVGVGVLFTSWGLKMKKRRKLYPSLIRWVFFIIPGTLLAVLGLVINATLETDDNYKYVHSAWHFCMGLGVLFLMPPRELPGKNEYHPMSELVDINTLHSDVIANDLNSELVANNDPGY